LKLLDNRSGPRRRKLIATALLALTLPVNAALAQIEAMPDPDKVAPQYRASRRKAQG
jgi:hypothetical protein